MSSTEPNPSSWPEGVHKLTFGDFGVGRDGRLFWDGKPVEVQQHIRFSWLQALGAIIIAVAALATGLKDGHEFGCAMGLWSKRCSFHEAPSSSVPKNG